MILSIFRSNFRINLPVFCIRLAFRSNARFFFRVIVIPVRMLKIVVARVRYKGDIASKSTNGGTSHIFPWTRIRIRINISARLPSHFVRSSRFARNTMIRYFSLTFNRFASSGSFVFTMFVRTCEIPIRGPMVTWLVQSRDYRPNFNVFVRALRRYSSRYIFSSSVANEIVRRFISKLSVDLQVGFMRFILQDGLITTTFRFRHISRANSQGRLYLLDINYIVFNFLRFAHRSRFVTLNRRCMGIFIAVNTFTRRNESVLQFMFLFSLHRLFQANSMAIINSATVLIRLRVVITMRWDNFVTITGMASRGYNVGMENVLIIVVSPSMRMVRIRAGYRPFVRVGEGMELGPFFSVSLVANFVMNGVNRKRIAINRIRFIKACRRT